MPSELGPQKDTVTPGGGTAVSECCLRGRVCLLLSAGWLLCRACPVPGAVPRAHQRSLPARGVLKGRAGLPASTGNWLVLVCSAPRAPSPSNSYIHSWHGVPLRSRSQGSTPGAIKHTLPDPCAKAALTACLPWGFVSLSPLCATAACIPLRLGKPLASRADAANISLLAGQARWWHLAARENLDLLMLLEPGAARAAALPGQDCCCPSPSSSMALFPSVPDPCFVLLRVLTQAIRWELSSVKD